MSTALDIIEQAYTWIGVLAAETPLQASEVQDGLRALNNRLSLWDAENILKGATPLQNSSDVIDIPRYAEFAVITRLAVDLAGQYSRQVSQPLAAAVSESYAGMVKAGLNIIVAFPSTLPRGSDDPWNEHLDDKFFPTNQRNNF